MPTARPSNLIGALRDAHWMGPERGRGYTLVFALTALVAVVGWTFASRTGLDPLGKALGTDFTSFWAASRLALEGQAAAAYDPAVHGAAQNAIFGRPVPYSAFFYPPVYLLICLPLALLPYLPSLAVWLASTGYAYWRVVRAVWGRGSGLALPVLAFPAVLLNLGHGQNAFLTTALFGAGALLLTRRPVLAGVCLGCLVFKPHLGLLIPIALLAAGAWRAFLSATATVLALAVATTLIFGMEIWTAFFAATPLARIALEQNLVGAEKMTSVFAAIRLWGGPLPVAYALQGVVSLAAAAAVVLVARRGEAEALGPALIAASLLASPFLLDYDLVLLAVPMAWALGRAQQDGFLPWEKLALGFGFVLPLASRPLAGALGLPLGPLAVLGILLVVARRGGALAHDADTVRRVA